RAYDSDKEKKKTASVRAAAISAAPVKTALNAEDRELFGRLRELRTAVSRERSVPAYIVFTNAALEEMAVKKPVTEEELMEINGVGKIKLEAFGELFIAAIKSYTEGK
ncbi:MAG: HRDC domain-containing protein, partial [Firmicutes bacterium]|nr:HRDC domain-containing protein [Bacillota bacterium]